MKYNFLFKWAFLAFIMLAIYSCEKDIDTVMNEEDSSSVSLRIASKTNHHIELKKILDKLNVSTKNGMLYFPSQETLFRYIEEIDVYTDSVPETEDCLECNITDPCLNDDFDAYRHADEPLYFIINDLLGVELLVTHYDRLVFESHEFKKALDLYIGDPDLQLVLNSNHEVQIGETIYKMLPDDHIGIVKNQDFKALSMLRVNGASARGSNVEVNTLGSTSMASIPSSSTECTSALDCGLQLCTHIEQNHQNNFNTVQLRPTLRDVIVDGIVPSIPCEISNFFIDWGDGDEETLEVIGGNGGLWKNITHTYDLDDLSPNECRVFTIVVFGSFESVVTGRCGDDCFDSPPFLFVDIDLEICKPDEPCISGNHINSNIPAMTFTHNGDEFKLEAEIGQTNTNNIFVNPKVWSRARFFKKKNGSFKKACPPKTLGTRIEGFFFVNECINEQEIIPAKEKSKKRKKVTAKHVIGQDFGTRRDGSKIIRADFFVKMDNSTTEEMLNIPLWD